eukprot:m.24896 g.24896  ORF g.24896 m.24896 type:complete len:314 (-) comp13123_c0_seq3:915-1856(-)
MEKLYKVKVFSPETSISIVAKPKTISTHVQRPQLPLICEHKPLLYDVESSMVNYLSKVKLFSQSPMMTHLSTSKSPSNIAIQSVLTESSPVFSPWSQSYVLVMLRDCTSPSVSVICTSYFTMSPLGSVGGVNVTSTVFSSTTLTTGACMGPGAESSVVARSRGLGGPRATGPPIVGVVANATETAYCVAGCKVLMVHVRIVALRDVLPVTTHLSTGASPDPATMTLMNSCVMMPFRRLGVSAAQFTTRENGRECSSVGATRPARGGVREAVIFVVVATNVICTAEGVDSADVTPQRGTPSLLPNAFDVSTRKQ